MFRRFAVVALSTLLLPASAAQAWTWPVDGPVLRPFSFDRAHPYAGGQHRGVDLGAPTGSEVLAPARGAVTFAGTVPNGGKTVSIETPFGYTATLVHLGSIGVQRGALVTEGSVVGTVGKSVVVDGAEPFVYFGVRVTAEDQGYVDPLTFLPGRPVVETSAPRPEPRPEPLATAEPGVAPPATHADAESAPEPSVSDAPAPKASTPETPATDVRASEAAPVEVQATEAAAAVSPAAETPVAPAAHPRRSAGAEVAAHAPPEAVAARLPVHAHGTRSVTLRRSARPRSPRSMPVSAADAYRRRSRAARPDGLGKLWWDGALALLLLGACVPCAPAKAARRPTYHG